MRPRRSRGALGLRGRILGAVLITTVATLAVAALALLGPLEHSLRTAELTTLRGEVGSTNSTAPKSITRTVNPIKHWNPEVVALADIAPVKEASTGGAPIKASALPNDS